jgi:phosphatidylglycerophosphatase A
MTAPRLRFLFAHPAHFIACGFGSGLSPIAPGTAGTLLAWLLYPLIKTGVPDLVFALFMLLCFAYGVMAAARTGRALGVVDHKSIVWDEMVPFWMVLLFTPPTLAWQAVAFLLFRLFDITKPQPARWVDRHMKNGFGVMLDDAIAAAYTVLVIALAVRLWG